MVRRKWLVMISLISITLFMFACSSPTSVEEPTESVSAEATDVVGSNEPTSLPELITPAGSAVPPAQDGADAKAGTEFGEPEDWTGGPTVGQLAMRIADVNGDGKGDFIAVDKDTTYALPSTGSGFGQPEDWTSGPVVGELGMFFADVTGDGTEDYIAVDRDSTYVLPSNGTRFEAPQDWTGGPVLGELGMFFADVTGDGKADFIAVDKATVYLLPTK